MGNYSKDRLFCIAQSLNGSGPSIWGYSDTGAVSTIAESAGFFTDAYDMGVRRGDWILVHAQTGTHGALSGLGVIEVQDTGDTQGTFGAATTVGDTS